MSYRWLKEALRYIHQKLLPKGVWQHAKDGRKEPEISPGTIWLVVLCGFMMQIPSFEQLGRLARDGMKKLLPRGQRPPSVDTVRDGIAQIDLQGLKQLFVHVMKRVKAMKAVTFLDGWRVGAIDGTHTFTSELHKCEDCRKAERSNGTVYYDHLGVYCHSVGPAPRLFWGYEPVHPGEGETTAAARLVLWLYTHFKHFVDVFVVDAGFAKAPFLKLLLSLGYHFVVRLKDPRMLLYRDAMGLFSKRAPDEEFEEKRGGRRFRVRLWEDENFSTWEEMPEAHRVVYVEETELNGRRKGTVHRIVVATDLNRSQAAARTIVKMIHARWVIENTGFHEAKGPWHLDHCYVHTAIAIQAIHWLQMLAINMQKMYLERHSRAFRLTDLTVQEIARRMEGELLYAADGSYRSVVLWDTS